MERYGLGAFRFRLSLGSVTVLTYCKRRARERQLVEIVARRLMERHGDLASDVVRCRLIRLAKQGGPPEAKFWGKVHQRIKEKG